MIDLRNNTVTQSTPAIERAVAGVALSLIVLRCKNSELSLRFYEQLGLRFAQEQHGNGPIHYAVSLNGIVIELYPSKQSDLSAEPMRMGFIIPSLSDTLKAMQAIGIQMISAPQSIEQCKSAILLDPDGHKIEITELPEHLYQQL